MVSCLRERQSIRWSETKSARGRSMIHIKFSPDDCAVCPSRSSCTQAKSSFRGESRFTTWAQKIAMNVALTELKRRRWRDVSLQDLFAQREGADRGPADPHLTSEQLALQNTVLGELCRMIDEELTDRQREVAVILEEMPVSEVARRMGISQNAPWPPAASAASAAICAW
jgi:hypothetical protein